MALFVRITDGSISEESSWLLTLECEWEAAFFGHHISRQQVTLNTPLISADEDTIRWYLEDLSSTSPFQLGKAKEASQKIAGFGRLVSSLLVTRNSTLQRIFHRAPYIVIELRLSSPNWRLAGLPWEALEDTNNWRGAVRPDISICVIRSASRLRPKDGLEQPVPKTTSPSTSRCQNILLVSSRSPGSQDILPDLLTLPIVGLVESLPAGRKPQLHFARPASWDRVCALIDAHEPGFFDIVHFDVHGVYAKRGEEGEGRMCLQLSALQAKNGAHDLIDVQEISAILGKAQVKLVVTNACRSGSLDQGWSNNLAASLASNGVLNAIGMSYKMSADGARMFTQAFYSQTLTGRDPWNAAQLARAYMRAKRDRHARFGRVVEVQDWIVPVLYTAISLDFTLATSNKSQLGKSAPMRSITAVEPGDDYPRGRAYDISRIEDFAFRKRTASTGTSTTITAGGCKVVLMHGMGGIGKSLLLRYLSWWWEVAQGFSRTLYLDFAERAWSAHDLEILRYCSTRNQRSGNDGLSSSIGHDHLKDGTGESDGLLDWVRRLHLRSGGEKKGVPGQAKMEAEQQTRMRPDDETRCASTAFILDNLDAVAAQNEEDGRRSWPVEMRNEFFETLRRCTGSGDVVILCSRVPLPWMEMMDKMGETLHYMLGPPASSADFGVVTGLLDQLGAAEKYNDKDEAIAIENITEFMSHHPAGLQAVTGLMINHCFAARRTYRFLHEMTFGFKQQPSPDAPLEERIEALMPSDVQDFSIRPDCRTAGDLQLAFNSARKDPMLITFLAILGCYRQLLPPDLAEIEDIVAKLAGLVEWEAEFRAPSLKSVLLWLEGWGLIDLSATTDTGYIPLSPLIWYMLQYLFQKAFGDVTIAAAKFIGYASFVKFTMTRLSTGRLDTLGEVPANTLEKASEIVNVTIALTHLTPTDVSHGPLIVALARDSSIASTMRIVRSFKVMLGPHVNPPHYSYFSAIFALESLSSRLGERSDLAQLEAIEGLCTLVAHNDSVSFRTWVEKGLERTKALQQEYSSRPGWLYFDFTFRFLSNATRLMKNARGFTREWNAGPLDAELVTLQSEPFAPIPRGTQYYTPYHTARLVTSIKALIGAHISRCPLVIINKLRSDIVASCDILLDDVTTAGDLRKRARKIRKFFANDFEAMPDIMQIYSLGSLVGSIPPVALDLLSDIGAIDLKSESTYDYIIEAIKRHGTGDSFMVSGILHLAGALSAWHRDDLDGAMEHLHAAERVIPPEDQVMAINLWYLYAKIYSKTVTALPLGSRERQEEKKTLCEAIAQILRLIELDPQLEVQVRNDPALLNMGRRLTMLFNDNGIRIELGILEWWHWRENKRRALNDPSFDGWEGYIGTPRFLSEEEKRKWNIPY